MPPTTRITFDDLRDQYDDELTDLRDAYEEATDHAREEYGDTEDWPPNVRAFVQMLEEGGKSIQERQHAIEQYRDRYDGDTFEIRPITGQESMDLEVEIRQYAKSKDLDPDDIRFVRKLRVVDVCTEATPEGVPEGNPSNCEEAIAMSLYDQVEALNSAGETGFTAPGFGDELPNTDSDVSAAPTPAETPSNTGGSSDTSVRPSGDS